MDKKAQKKTEKIVVLGEKMSRKEVAQARKVFEKKTGIPYSLYISNKE